MEKPVKIVVGTGKTLEIFGDKVRIAPSGFRGLLLKFSSGVGSCEVPLKNITSIEFSSASILTRGYLVVNYPGAPSITNHGNALESNLHQNNAIHFGWSVNDEMKEAKKIIDDLIAKNGGSAGVSAADELKKFAELHRQGTISTTEFETKKRQLLSL